jgi:hypothetical protein
MTLDDAAVIVWQMVSLKEDMLRYYRENGMDKPARETADESQALRLVLCAATATPTEPSPGDART